MRSDRVDLVIALVIIGFAVVGVLDAVDFRAGAKLLPLLTLSALLGLSAVIAFKALAHKEEVKRIDVPALRLVSVLALCLVYTFLIDKIGFFISSILFFILIVAIFDRKRFVSSIFVSIGLSAFIYVVFSLGFDIYLPPGELWG
jgi:putative tricarboxylic transport membrane protein